MSWKVKKPHHAASISSIYYGNSPLVPWLIEKCHVQPVWAGRGSVAKEIVKSLMREEKKREFLKLKIQL